VSLSYDAEHVFTNVQLISDYEQEVPVVLKLGNDCLQIASVSAERQLFINIQWKKQELSTQLRSYIIDVIQLQDIDDVVAGQHLTSDHLVIKHNQTQVATLVTKSKSVISFH
jgi:neurofibromin 1